MEKIKKSKNREKNKKEYQKRRKEERRKEERKKKKAKKRKREEKRRSEEEKEGKLKKSNLVLKLRFLQGQVILLKEFELFQFFQIQVKLLQGQLKSKPKEFRKKDKKK